MGLIKCLNEIGFSGKGVQEKIDALVKEGNTLLEAEAKVKMEFIQKEFESANAALNTLKKELKLPLSRPSKIAPLDFDAINKEYQSSIKPAEVSKAEEVKPEVAPAKEKAAPKLKASLNTKQLFQKAVNLFYDISGTEGASKKRTISAKRRTFMEQNPSIKYIDDNWTNISKQLEAKGLLKKEGNCP